jgi:hypothetical protein
MHMPTFWLVFTIGQFAFLILFFCIRKYLNAWIEVPVRRHQNPPNDGEIEWRYEAGTFDVKILRNAPFDFAYTVVRNKYPASYKSAPGQNYELWVSDLIWLVTTSQLHKVAGWCRVGEGLRLFEVTQNKSHRNVIYVRVMSGEILTHDTMIMVRVPSREYKSVMQKLRRV